ncbi:hypothetical protein Tco_0325207 [Tanacetum coccineum]
MNVLIAFSYSAEYNADVNVNALAEQAPLWHQPTSLKLKSASHQMGPIGKKQQLFGQFWDTVQYDNKTESYSCQLDEKLFNLTKDTIEDALQITPVDTNNAFSSPLTVDALIKFVNDLGYLRVVKTLSDVVTNDMFQPWRSLTIVINLCLTIKTSGFERPRALVLQILWGIVNRAHIDYAERVWEEFTQSIHTFIEDKKNLAHHTQGKKKATLIVIPSVRFTKLIIYYLQSKHKFCPRPASKQSKPLAPKAATKKPKPAPAKPQEKKRKLVTETSEEPSPAKRSKAGKVVKKRTKKSSLQLVDEFVDEVRWIRMKKCREWLLEFKLKARLDQTLVNMMKVKLNNPVNASTSQPPSIHVVHAGPNLEHMDLEASDTSIQPNPEQMDE